MSYATQADLVARFSEGTIADLSDRENAGAIDGVRVDQALSDASARIDGFLADRYTLPLATVPAALVPICCDMARYLLADIPTDQMKDRWDDALAWLGKVAEGKYGLGLDSTSQEIPATGGARSTPSDRVFTRRTLRDFTKPRIW
jgi:phage gp36-like protein